MHLSKQWMTEKEVETPFEKLAKKEASIILNLRVEGADRKTG